MARNRVLTATLLLLTTLALPHASWAAERSLSAVRGQLIRQPKDTSVVTSPQPPSNPSAPAPVDPVAESPQPPSDPSAPAPVNPVAESPQPPSDPSAPEPVDPVAESPQPPSDPSAPAPVDPVAESPQPPSDPSAPAPVDPVAESPQPPSDPSAPAPVDPVAESPQPPSDPSSPAPMDPVAESPHPPSDPSAPAESGESTVHTYSSCSSDPLSPLSYDECSACEAIAAPNGKAWACNSYCTAPHLVGTSHDLAVQCAQCVTSVAAVPYPQGDPYGCSSCFEKMNVLEAAGVGKEAADHALALCLSCITSFQAAPSGAEGTYTWSCSACAGISDLQQQAACFDCTLTCPDVSDQAPRRGSFCTDPARAWSLHQPAATDQLSAATRDALDFPPENFPPYDENDDDRPLGYYYNGWYYYYDVYYPFYPVEPNAPLNPPPPTMPPAPPITPYPEVEARDWNTFGYDLARTGYNTYETGVNQLNAHTLELAWTFDSVGAFISQATHILDVDLLGGVKADVVYLGDLDGHFYAINADTGALIWTRSSGFWDGAPCYLLPEGHLGIGGTAQIDRETNLVYMATGLGQGRKPVYGVASGLGQVLAYDLATGEIPAGWNMDFLWNPVDAHNYGGITIHKGVLYVTGEVIALNQSNGEVLQRFYPTGYPNFPYSEGKELFGAGVWGNGGVTIADDAAFFASGNIYPNGEGIENQALGEHVVRTSLDLKSVQGNFTPGYLGWDADVGASPVIINDPSTGCLRPILVCESKGGVLIQLYADTMEEIDIITLAQYSQDGQFTASPAYSPPTQMLYVSTPTNIGDIVAGLVALKLGSDCRLTQEWNTPLGVNLGPSGGVTTYSSPVVTAGDVVMLVNGPQKTLFAVDAVDGRLLWEYELDGWVFSTPSVNKGMVFVGDWNAPDKHKLYAFKVPDTQ
eukprot:gene21396-28352_t